MYKMTDVASYICSRYMRENNKRIDEMKLHKLMYFAQREALVQTNDILFQNEFEAWKYGPVLPVLRGLYKQDAFDYDYSNAYLDRIMDNVFSEYAHILPWSLSMISHGEESWKRARVGIPEGENGCQKIKTDDIRIDANRVRMMREKTGLSK